ncbi:MAG: N-acetylmuramoyl-L-alanine amidase [Muribaculaceae bacterium]|nr:N-acetylmuramoyl-L-alanine amidase [Muribaculaceae bacterium]
MNIKRGIKLILFSVAMVICMAPLRAAENRKEFVVVIDAGHGGNDVGAVDNGVREKDINLAVAKRLQEDLQRKMKNVKVIMTRSNDNFVTLQGRADIANKNHADLFISIHTNSVDAKNPNRKSVCGTSVYALGLHKDKENLNIAKRENSVIELEKDHAEKYSGFDPTKDESYIIFEMAQKKNLEQSLRFANFAQKQLVNHSGRKDRGVKQAGFWVLWATSMPAVLVELDFICNPNEAKFMGSNEGERKMAEALCNAVVEYYKYLTNSGGVSKRASLNSRKTDSSSNSYTALTPSTTPSQKNVAMESASVKKVERNDTPPSVGKSHSSGKVTTARKRRSASSKLTSEKRDVTTSQITVKREKDYLAKKEEAKVEAKKPEPVVKETAKEKKKRLEREKKEKRKSLNAKKK